MIMLLAAGLRMDLQQQLAGRFNRLYILTTLVVCAAAISTSQFGSVRGWGKDGHYITCSIAESLLTEETKAAVAELIGGGDGLLAPHCDWPDTVRRTRAFHWSGSLHFINTPDFQCSYNHQRDCHGTHGEPDMCVAGGISNFTSQLTTYQAGQEQSRYNLTVALLFLAHLIGDIHQPLHVGYTGDEGGNSIEVHWYKRKANLHHVWDSSIIDTARDRYFEKDLDLMVENLVQNVSDNWNSASKWELCHSREIACPDAYARESIKVACKWAYKDVTDGATLGDDYFLTRLPIVKEQLSKGGVRLAYILNQALGGKSTDQLLSDSDVPAT